MRKIECAIAALLLNCLPSMLFAADAPAGTLRCSVPPNLPTMRNSDASAECWFTPAGANSSERYAATLKVDASLVGGLSDGASLVIAWTVYGPNRAGAAAAELTGTYRTTLPAAGLQGPVLRLELSRDSGAARNVATAVTVLNLQRPQVTTAPSPSTPVAPPSVDFGFYPQPARPAIEEFFPWPPPPASALTTLPKSLFGDAKRFRHVADAAEFIEQSLHNAGFDQWGYFSLPDEPAGFGLVSRLEQFDPKTGDALAGGSRWSMELAGARDISVWRALFMLHRPFGRYRLFVFVLSTQPTADKSSEKPATMELAQWWNNRGRRFLPDDIGQRNLTPAHRLIVRVYEFNQEDKGPSELVPHSSFNASQHLKAAGIRF